MTGGGRTPVGLRALATKAAWLFVCGFLPAVAIYEAIGPSVTGRSDPVDFHYAYYPAAEAILAGRDFLPVDGFVIRGEPEFVIDYVYPPLIAVVSIPLTLLPLEVAQVVFQVVLVLAFVATLAVLGVRDWRCYGLAFLWPPVTDAVFTGNVTILLGLAAALVWRFRDSPAAGGASLGASIGAKIFLWPLGLWMGATRRWRALAWSVALGAVALVLPWGLLGFRGLAEYPDLLRRLSGIMDDRSYTVYALGLDIGLQSGVARVLWLALAASTVVACVVLARRGSERSAFVLALGAAIACSPIVWLHYFALLLVIVAIVQPHLGVLWFVGLPLQLFVMTGLYNGSPAQTTAVLVTAALTVALALHPPEPFAKGRRRAVSSPIALRP